MGSIAMDFIVVSFLLNKDFVTEIFFLNIDKKEIVHNVQILALTTYG